MPNKERYLNSTKNKHHVENRYLRNSIQSIRNEARKVLNNIKSPGSQYGHNGDDQAFHYNTGNSELDLDGPLDVKDHHRISMNRSAAFNKDSFKKIDSNHHNPAAKRALPQLNKIEQDTRRSQNLSVRAKLIGQSIFDKKEINNSIYGDLNEEIMSDNK